MVVPLVSAARKNKANFSAWFRIARPKEYRQDEFDGATRRGQIVQNKANSLPSDFVLMPCRHEGYEGSG
jgi:hypothetical protein